MQVVYMRRRTGDEKVLLIDPHDGRRLPPIRSSSYKGSADWELLRCSLKFTVTTLLSVFIAGLADRGEQFLLDKEKGNVRKGGLKVVKSVMDPVTMLANIAQLIQMVVMLGDKAKSQKINCQNLASRIKLLKPLLDEVRDTKIPLNNSAVVSLETLEGAILKAKGLFEKCGGKSSKLYMVLRCQMFVNKFQDVTVEIDRSLTSLPLATLRISDQIRSQVERLTLELRRTRYLVDASDERISQEIESLLRDQREGRKPSFEMLCKLADWLEIGSKEFMLKELSALEQEEEEARVDCDKLEEEYISQMKSLLECMVEEIGEQKAGGLQMPPDFRCPLSLELMSDPVIVASGQTYERLYIQQWLDQGNTTCPKTRQTLSHTNLIPNYTVKALIANWCEANNVPLPEPAKIDMLNTFLRPLAPVTNAKVEPEERNAESPPRPLQQPIVMQHLPERGMAGVASRPPPRSRRTFQSRSADGSEGDRNYGSDNRGSGELLGEASQPATRFSVASPDGEAGQRRISLLKDGESGNESSSHHRSASGSSVASSVEDGQVSTVAQDSAPTVTAPPSVPDSSPYPSDISEELERLEVAPVRTEESGSPSRANDPRMGGSTWRRRAEERDQAMPRIVPTPLQDTLGADANAHLVVDGLVQDLLSEDVEVHRHAAAELRLLAKYNQENRIVIANAGAIKPLVALLNSTDSKTQENAVTALLNLSINDNNKSEIAAAGAIDPLVNVLRVGNSQAMENAAATLFSLSVMDDNKVTIGASGAIPPLVDLLINGTPRGKKDAATALFNLSIYHENKSRIVRAGAIRPLVELMADPAAGMVDKAVAVLANLATIPDGRVAVGDEGGIPALVEVVEAGSQRGKENAAAALLQLCMNSHRHRALVLQEGAIPPLVALSQSGTARAKEKASALLRHFREQRHQGLGPRPGPDRHA
ncbi:hypothetical protein R1flu_015182 [Riccia fluitans]|uniref:RING-type E3 ubiquitin transferase n=1 Tax=Riccia fluitans TaxID=41844 RepID=A0ABD1YI73_9MARC